MLLPALLAALALAPEPQPSPPAPPPPPAAPRSLRAPPPPPAAPRAPDGRRAGAWPGPSGKKVSLEGRMSLDDALERIAGAAGWNLAANTGRAGDRTLVLSMKAVPVEEALDAVLEGTSLVATRRGESVTVAPGAIPPAAEAPVLSGFDKPTGRKFSGDFDDETVDEALKRVADAGGLSLVLPPGLRGVVNAHFKDAPVEDVLRVLLSQAGLTARREGSIVTVARGAGTQVVIQGKRRISVPGVEIDLDKEIGQATREAERAMKEANREAKEGNKAAGKGRHGRKDKVLSGDQVIGPGEKVQEVVVLRGDVRMEPGSEAAQVTAIAGSVSLGPGVQVEREVVSILGSIRVGPGARIGGDAVSVGGSIVIDPGGEIDGQQVSVNIPGVASILTGLGPMKPFATPNPWLRALSVVAEFAVFFVLGLLFLLLAPRRLEAVTASLGHAPLKTVLTGLLATVAMPLLAVLLVATLIGIPLVAVQALGIALAGVLGFSALALYIGRSAPLPSERGGQVLRLAIGTALIVILGKIPVLGTLAWVAAWLLVFGAVVRTRFGQIGAAPLETTAVPPAPPPAAPA